LHAFVGLFLHAIAWIQIMKHQDLINFLDFSGKDPSRLIFEDELTDIYNRRFLFHYLEHKISWTRLQHDPLSLIMMDVDHFKQVNDTYGHQAGDQVLVWIAGMLQEVAVYDPFGAL
jgi:GGDEF domain-containing protein